MLVTGAFAIELLLVSVLYVNDFSFTCRDRAPAAFCGFLSLGPARALAAAAALALVLLSRRRAVAEIARRDLRRPQPAWLAAHGIGYFAVLAPWAFLDDGSSAAAFTAAVALWLEGAALWIAGGALAVAPSKSWAGLVRLGGVPLSNDIRNWSGGDTGIWPGFVMRSVRVPVRPSAEGRTGVSLAGGSCRRGW